MSITPSHIASGNISRNHYSDATVAITSATANAFAAISLHTVEVDTTEVATIINGSFSNPQKVVLIDVRSKEEIKANGSILIPKTSSVTVKHIDSSTFQEQIGSLGDKDCMIIIYCRSGRRSLVAVNTARNFGYSNATSMRGGMEKWIAERLSVQFQSKI